MKQLLQHRYFPLLAIVWAAIVWFVLFGVRGIPLVFSLLFAAVSLTGIAVLAAPGQYQQRWSLLRLLTVGIGSSIVLYGICFVGNWVLYLILPGGMFELEIIYSLRSQLQPVYLGVLLIGFVAIAEELFWRKYLQSILMSKLGRKQGWYAASLIYAGIHIVTNNPILFLAALVAGLFWGWMYYRTQNIWVSIVSHVTWTMMAYFLFPFQSMQGNGYV